jgi:cytochrome c556
MRLSLEFPMRLSLPFVALAGFLLLCSAGEAAALSVKAEMKQVVEPASNTLFGVGGDVDPANGPDAAKVAASRWTEAATAATKLKAVATGLSEKGRAKPGPEWATFARQMAELSDKAMKAAAAHDGAGLAQAANDLSDNCAACHTKFKPQTGD